MKPRNLPRFDAAACLDRYMELEAIRTAAILARARAEAEACMSDPYREAEIAYLFSEDAYFRH
jgi:hypothetical protein